ncbi:TRAP transporter small permease [Pikeienuella sp. HZG-20]|uniref:TRAP transporter small permease n=1 Tax=Paludibacillus litoralis TaxID=3133267 RepID=UPI0030EB7D42
MTGGAGRAPDEAGADSALGRFSRLVGRFEDGLNVLAAATIFLIMIGTTVGIASRLAGWPIPGFLDVSEQAIAVFAFLGAAYAQRLGAHIRMELGVGALRGRLRWLTEALASALALLLVLVLIRYSWDFFLNAYLIGDSTVDYEIPTWPAKLLVPIAFTIWALRLAIEVAGFLRLAIWPGAAPVAVPITPTVAEQAQHEIRGL